MPRSHARGCVGAAIFRAAPALSGNIRTRMRVPGARMRVRAAVSLLVAFIALVSGTPAALAARSDAKAIWGPVIVDGRSQFPLYHALGVGIFQIALDWADVAPTQPANPTDPNDPAYQWPADVSYAIQHAAHYHMRIMLQVGIHPAVGKRWPGVQLSAHGHEQLGRLHHGCRASLPQRSPVDDLGRAESPGDVRDRRPCGPERHIADPGAGVRAPGLRTATGRRLRGTEGRQP